MRVWGPSIVSTTGEKEKRRKEERKEGREEEGTGQEGSSTN